MALHRTSIKGMVGRLNRQLYRAAVRGMRLSGFTGFQQVYSTDSLCRIVFRGIRLEDSTVMDIVCYWLGTSIFSIIFTSSHLHSVHYRMDGNVGAGVRRWDSHFFN